MSRTLYHAVALGLLALPSQAQELTFGKATFGYNMLSEEELGSEMSIARLGGAAEFQLDRFMLGGEVQNQQFEYEVGDIGERQEETLNRVSLYAGYAVTPEVLVGFDYDTFTSKYGSSSYKEAGTSVAAQYQNAAFGVAVSHRNNEGDYYQFQLTTVSAQAKLGAGVTLGAIVENYSEFDQNPYHLSAEYGAGPLFVRGYYAGLSDLDASVYGLRAEYDLSSAVAVLGGFEATSGDALMDYSSFSLGGAYHFSDAISIEAMYSDMNSDDFAGGQTMSVLLNYETGASKRLDKTMFRDALDDTSRGAFATMPDLGHRLLFALFMPG